MELKKKTVYETVSSYELPSDVDGFIKFIEDKIAGFGVDRDSVIVEIVSSEEYGSIYSHLEFSYTRLETEKEAQEREAGKKWAEAYELSQYLALKKKFEESD